MLAACHLPKQRPVTAEVQMNRNVYKRQPKGAAPDARATEEPR
jgi:hypothetical protein